MGLFGKPKKVSSIEHEIQDVKDEIIREFIPYCYWMQSFLDSTHSDTSIDSKLTDSYNKITNLMSHFRNIESVRATNKYYDAVNNVVNYINNVVTQSYNNRMNPATIDTSVKQSITDTKNDNFDIEHDSNLRQLLDNVERIEQSLNLT